MQRERPASAAALREPDPTAWESPERDHRWARLEWWESGATYLLTVTDEETRDVRSVRFDRLTLHQLVSWGASELRHRPPARRI